MNDNTHVHGAVYDESNPSSTSCLEVPGCGEIENKGPIDECRIVGGPVETCTWDAEHHQFVCIHVNVHV